MRVLRSALTAASLAMLFLATPARAGASDATQERVHTLSAADLEEFLTPVMEQQITKHHVAGAVVVVVKDGGMYS
jgi:CubicO group peptidase (beta-lactamase class C family)